MNAYGWGSKGHGELGQPPDNPKLKGFGNSELSPVSMMGENCNLAGRTDIADILPMYFSCHVVKAGGGTDSFAGRQMGQLCNGEGLGHELNVPTEGPEHSGQFAALPSLLPAFQHAATWGAHGIVLLADGTPRTWGGNLWGCIGNGLSANGTELNDASEYIYKEPGIIVTEPFAPAWHPAWTGVAVATGNTAAGVLIDHEGERRVAIWGHNGAGQLADGTTTDKLTPGLASALGVEAFALGGSHTLILDAEGKVYGYGTNSNGELGIGTIDNKAHGPAASGSSMPARPVKGLPLPVVAIFAGGKRSMALLTDGSLWAWGINPATIPVTQTTINTPTPERLLDNVTGVVCGQVFDVAISGGEVKCRGENAFGQCGDGTQEHKPTFVGTGLTGATRVAASYDSGYALV